MSVTFVCKNQSDMLVKDWSKESFLNQPGNNMHNFFSLPKMPHRNTIKAEGNDKGRITKHKCMKLVSMIFCQLNIVLMSPLWFRPYHPFSNLQKYLMRYRKYFIENIVSTLDPSIRLNCSQLIINHPLIFERKYGKVVQK